jgi:S-adenosylmethionine/arginine decarboxylase-like enzyme
MDDDTRPQINPAFPVYGYELVLDLHGCDSRLFNRRDIEIFFDQLCTLIDMEKCEVHFWDDVGVPETDRQILPHTKGTSAVCFILTSSIVIHTLDLLQTAYINIFSCKHFDHTKARNFSSNWFRADKCYEHSFVRV